MAKVNSIGANRTATSEPRPIAYETHEFYWLAIGTREQLLSAGLCTPSHFPSGRRRAAYGADWWLKAVRGDQWKLYIQRTEKMEAQLGRDAIPRLRPSLRLVVSNE